MPRLRRVVLSRSAPSARAEPQVKAEEQGALFRVQQNGKWGYMDQTGKIVVAPKFAGAGEFSEGLGAVLVDKKWGYVDGTGSMVLKPRFDECGNFSEGLAAV